MDSISSLNAGGLALLAAILLLIGWIVQDNSTLRWKLRLIISLMAVASAAWWENERRLEAQLAFHVREYLEEELKENRRVRKVMRTLFDQFKHRLTELPESQQLEVANRIPPELVELLQSGK